MNKYIKIPFWFLFVLFIFLIYPYIILAQPNTVWSTQYNGFPSNDDSAIAMCSNSNGNIFVTGWSAVSTGLPAIVVTIRYNPTSGDSIWVSRYSPGAGLDCKPYAITANNNSVYVTGYAWNPTRDILTIKYDAATGVQQWAKTYNGPGNGGDYGWAITVDGSGNVYVTGRTDNGSAQKMVVLKYDASGNMVSGWPVIYSGPQSGVFDESHSIKLDASNNVYITGLSKLTSGGYSDYLTVKINSDGSIGWAKRFNGTSNMDDNAVALVLDASNQNVFVAGWATLNGNYPDYATIKYKASTGDSLAFANYNGTGNYWDYTTAMTIDPSDNVYVTGYSLGAFGYDYATIKYNSSLSQAWVAGSSANYQPNYPNAIAYSMGFIYVTGTSFHLGNYDYLTCRYDASSGVEKWTVRFNGTANGDDRAISIVVIDSFDVFITGTAKFTGTTNDFCTIRYSEPVGVKKISSDVPSAFSLSQNYPNPFNPATTIDFDVPKTTLTKLSVYDILGREIEVLVNEYLKPGIYQVKWFGNGFSSGVYFYRISTTEINITKKMILNK